MCTLIVGLGAVGRGTLLLGANRDEDPARPSDAPLALNASPPLAGGRDRVAGGTWLAVRGRDAVVAVLNRRARASHPPQRSRGLLALDVALAREPLQALRRAAAAHAYGPWSLVFASPGGGWVARGGGDDATELHVDPLTPGWHVLTHTHLDDGAEPRVAWLRAALARGGHIGRDAALAHVAGLLATHAAPGIPGVCLHEGPMPTRSSTRVWLAPGEACYLHAEGPPCVTPWRDVGGLLAAESAR